jgi:hypothetical protein
MSDEGPEKKIDEGQRIVHVGVASMLIGGAICLAIGYKVGGPVIDEVGYPLKPIAERQADGAMLVTLNTSDQERWIPFSFELGREVPQGAAADVLIRRHYWQVPGGAVSLDVVPLADAALSAEPAWIADGLSDGFHANPVMLRWYDYSYWTHLLESKHEIYAIKLRGDASRAALIRLESYYCAPEGSGCMTFRYRMIDID